MAQLTLADLLNEAQDIIPTIPQAKVVRAVNKVLLRIHAETTHPEYSTFTTRAKVTTGTVSVTQDSTAVTFSSSVLANTDGLRLLQIEGDNAWFVLAYVSGTQGTLSSKWAPATDATATYTLVFPTVSFPANVGQVTRIWQDGMSDLDYCPDRGADFWSWEALTTSGDPRRWCPYTHDTAATPDDALRIMLQPATDTRETFMYAYHKRPTLLTAGGATSQTIPLPDIFNEAVVAGVMAYVYEIREGVGKAGAKWGFFQRCLDSARAATSIPAVIMPRPRATFLRAYSPRPYNP